jgi:hypothetical protein
MRRSLVLGLSGLLGSLALASNLAAQSLSIGNAQTTTNSSDITVATVRTDIDLVTPATATGTVDTASFVWSAEPCPDAVKIKFFRRQADTLVFLDERGPFTTGLQPQTVALAPPVAVQQGDLIGIARVADCGSPSATTGIVTAGYLAYAGDVTSAVSLSGGIQGNGVLAVSASGTATEYLARVIPAAGSAPGAFGSFFRTGVQLFNPGTLAVSGRFVYHPAGTSGSSSDPSLTFTIAPSATISYDDLVQTMGQTSVGSIDVILPSGSQFPPVIAARVFNDAGAAGTTGFTEDGIDLTSDNRFVFAGATGFLDAPADPVKFRFNIGVRTFFSGATILFGQRDASGALVRTASKTYPPTYFEQQPAANVLGGPVGPNDSIEVSVSGGSAIVYGATVDNTTNDPSAQFVRVVFAIAGMDVAPEGSRSIDERIAVLRREESELAVVGEVGRAT